MPTKAKNFQTQRTTRFLSEEKPLSAAEKRTVATIEQFGCQVIHVQHYGVCHDFYYTVGLYDTCGQPEVIAIGLLPETAHFLLNEAAARLRNGLDLTQSRQARLVGEVECEFRQVGPMWILHLMGIANWYYAGATIPVLQAIYPDRNNTFPGERGFDKAYSQPLLQPGRRLRRIDQEFWFANASANETIDWKFDDSPDKLVFLTAGVHQDNEPINFVVHNMEDAAWQFLGKSGVGGRMPVVACYRHVIEKDPTLSELADLPLGWQAKRAAVGAPWVREPERAKKQASRKQPQPLLP